MTDLFKKTDAVAMGYLLLARSFSFPDLHLQEIVKKWERLGTLDNTIVLPFKVEPEDIPYPSRSWEDMESLYITTFDIGAQGGPPCPLYEGLVRKDEAREGIIMEVLRFYDYFDVRLSEKERDFPDHLATELEFMAYLVQKETTAAEDGKDSQPYRQAQLDFLERHLSRWVPILDDRLQGLTIEPFYQKISAILRRFIEAHAIYLREVCACKENNDIGAEVPASPET